MKVAVLIAFIFIAFEALALEVHYRESNVNFDAKEPYDSDVMMCDDTYYSGVELLIPGESKFPEASIKLNNCDADWRITKKMTTTVKGKPYTLIRFKGGGECTFDIYGKNKAGQRVKYVLEMYDAC